jgi:CRISPR-associated protein Csd1
MLIQALANYADTYLADALEDPAFEEKPVGWVIAIHPDGTFAQLLPRVREVSVGKKVRSEPLPLPVPKSPVSRNSGVYALPGCDAVSYVVGPADGWLKEKDPDKRELERQKQQRQHADFVRKATEIAAQLQDSDWQVAAKFLQSPAEVERARNALGDAKVKLGQVTLAVVVPEASSGASTTLVERPKFRAWWRGQFKSDAGARVDAEGAVMCLVSGVIGPVAETHEKIKGITSLGGQGAGVALMSFDKKAFQSYGWEKNFNSPVSPDRATAYVLALNDLLRFGAHRRGASDGRLVTTRKDLAGTGFLFWTEKPTDDDLLSLLNEPSEDSVRSLLDSVRSGQPPSDVELNNVFLLAVAGNGGRLVVRHWSRESLATMRRRVAAWFEGLRMADVFHGGQVVQDFPLWKLVGATEREGLDSIKVPPSRGLALVRRALEGAPLGHALLGALLGRLRASPGTARLLVHRLALLRMCVNDLATQSGEALMTETLDESLNHPSYLCGRLLAVFDSLQYASQGDVGVTVVDRYYSLASTNPSIAFPKIEQLGRYHLKKLRRDKGGAAWAIEGRLAELHARIGEHGGRFPGQLSLEDQGRFAIGFHHQKADDRVRMAERKAEKKAEQAKT